MSEIVKSNHTADGDAVEDANPNVRPQAASADASASSTRLTHHPTREATPPPSSNAEAIKSTSSDTSNTGKAPGSDSVAQPESLNAYAKPLASLPLKPSLAAPHTTDEQVKNKNVVGDEAQSLQKNAHGETTRQAFEPPASDTSNAEVLSSVNATVANIAVGEATNEHSAPSPKTNQTVQSPGGDATVNPEWRVVCETVPGASHLRAGIPNQDAALMMRPSSCGAPVIVAISDGHGSDKCFRSDRGSRFAVRIACEILDELTGDSGRHLAPSDIEHRVRETLSAHLVQRWRAAVEADLTQHPISEAEINRMIDKDGAGARQVLEANPLLAYGATLLCALVMPNFVVYLQLGDGEILVVNQNGNISLPLQEDARLIANETTSLCLEKAVADFRCAVQPFDALTVPALILLTTDGYANSFATSADFHKVATDIIALINDEGFDYVNRHVHKWLADATQAGSGDDCTLALIVCMNVLPHVKSNAASNA